MNIKDGHLMANRRVCLCLPAGSATSCLYTNAELGSQCSQTCTGSLRHHEECIIPSYLIIWCWTSDSFPRNLDSLMKYSALSKILAISSMQPCQFGDSKSSFCNVITRKYAQRAPWWQLPGEMKCGCTFKKILCSFLFPVRCCSKDGRLCASPQLVLYSVSCDARLTGSFHQNDTYLPALELQVPRVSDWEYPPCWLDPLTSELQEELPALRAGPIKTSTWTTLENKCPKIKEAYDNLNQRPRMRQRLLTRVKFPAQWSWGWAWGGVQNWGLKWSGRIKPQQWAGECGSV